MYLIRKSCRGARAVRVKSPGPVLALTLSSEETSVIQYLESLLSLWRKNFVENGEGRLLGETPA